LKVRTCKSANCAARSGPIRSISIVIASDYHLTSTKLRQAALGHKQPLSSLPVQGPLSARSGSQFEPGSTNSSSTSRASIIPSDAYSSLLACLATKKSEAGAGLALGEPDRVVGAYGKSILSTSPAMISSGGLGLPLVGCRVIPSSQLNAASYSPSGRKPIV
jgi:hypothetical protein